ncbi:OmpA family protein [Roseateles sp. DAIF2]|uniref:OmpA family protein n=1 Tax=Roseateles sp. DAIF2 TaxID=2714952 RepID=UPI0018A2E190|nr:OmpA family protein [Roseateles sp. DAIF2]QPF74396.1 OmpA family protein [Roseateles sp. DAIF2]
MKYLTRFLLPLLLLLLAACQQLPPAPSAAPPRWTEAQVQALRSLGFSSEDGEEWSLNLAASLLFDFDSERLKPQQMQQLEQVGRTLAGVGVPGLRIEGHSDNVGDADYNRRLSLRRAGSVAQALAAAGLQADKLPTQGFGSAKPIADNASESGRAQNRRVVLIAPSL